jgi:serine/threonine protein kinase
MEIKPKRSAKYLSVNETVTDRYRVQHEIGKGGGGVVFQALDLLSGRTVALKVACKGKSTLGWEWQIDTAMKSAGRPGLFLDMVTTSRISVLIMNRYDGDLMDVIDGPKMSSEFLMHAAQRMLEQLHALHQCDFVHRDVKPSNFLHMKDSNGNKDPHSIVLTDYGCAAKYMEALGPTKKRHVDLEPSGPFSGSAMYASRRQLRQLNCSRADDMESFAYLLLSLFGCPVPPQIAKFIYEVGDLKFDQHPEYLLSF